MSWKNRSDKIFAVIAKNKPLLVIFLLSTSFFAWQHQFISWDFASYASNADYWQGDIYRIGSESDSAGFYYEISRPPLVPVILYLLGIFPLSEYIFIILASLLFLYSSVRFADCVKIRREFFYIFSLSPVALFYGMLNGTELLSLALLELFLVYLLEKKPQAGMFLGLAFLTRYNFLIFFPLIFSNRYPKKIAATIALFLIPMIPWLAFNFITTGNMLTSLADSFALNFKYRYYFTQPSSILHILTALSFLLPLFLLGLWQAFRKWNFKPAMKFLCSEKAKLLLIVVIALSLYQYLTTPSKELRYLFPLVLPVAYFSAKGIETFRKKAAIIAIILVALNLTLFASMNTGYETRERYQDAINILKSNQIENCRVLSNAWPIMNYIGQPSEPFPRKELLGKAIEEGNIVILFPSMGEPEWMQDRDFIREFPAVYESSELIVLGTGECNPPMRYEHNYMALLHEKIRNVYNVSINTNPCFVMFRGGVLENTCNFANGKGFVLDENREDGLLLVRD